MDIDHKILVRRYIRREQGSTTSERKLQNIEPRNIVYIAQKQKITDGNSNLEVLGIYLILTDGNHIRYPTCKLTPADCKVFEL